MKIPIRLLLSPLAFAFVVGPHGVFADVEQSQIQLPISRSAELNWSGYVGMEQRLFLDDSPIADFRADTSIVFQPRISWSGEWGEFVVEPFVRADRRDSSRSHWDVREFKYKGRVGPTYLTVGMNRVFWGVAESVHLVDFLNQDDLLEDVDGEEKLGQPMIEIVYPFTGGELSAYALVGFRELEVPGPGQRPGLPFEGLLTTYESEARDRRVDAAVRWLQLVGSWDISLSYFSGTSRDPVMSLPEGRDLTVHYPLVERWGVSLAGVLGSWLLKTELVTQRNGPEYTASVSGFEYTIYDVFDGGIDLGFAAEYAKDTRSALEAVAQNDAFLGLRFTFNDSQATQLLVGGLWDLSSSSRFLTLEGSRRFGDVYRATVEARLFGNVAPDDALYPLHDESYVGFGIARYF